MRAQTLLERIMAGRADGKKLAIAFARRRDHLMFYGDKLLLCRSTVKIGSFLPLTIENQGRMTCVKCRRALDAALAIVKPATPPERADFLAACGRVGEAIRTKL